MPGGVGGDILQVVGEADAHALRGKEAVEANIFGEDAVGANGIGRPEVAADVAKGICSEVDYGKIDGGVGDIDIQYAQAAVCVVGSGGEGGRHEARAAGGEQKGQCVEALTEEDEGRAIG